MRDIHLAKIIKIGSLVLLFGLIIGFAYLKTRDFLFGVRLEIEGLQNNANYQEPVVLITGRAKNVRFFAINDNEVFIDPAGNFEDTRLLLPGLNKIAIESLDRFGKTEVRNYEVTYFK